MEEKSTILDFCKLLLKQVSSTFMESLKVLVLLLFFSMESFIILQNVEPVFHIVPFSVLLIHFISLAYISKTSPVYVVDFTCFKPPNYLRAPFSTYIEHATKLDFFDDKSVSFISKILQLSGLGDQTYFPPGLFYIPPRSGQKDAINEVHMVLFAVFEDLLSKTNISPEDIDILIVNCSGFCPSPSLSSIIVNKYALKEGVKSYTISGMGCSANSLAIDMARNIMKTHKNFNAVILSTEILSTGWYPGRERAFMILNCIFRMGGAAVLLSNKKEAKRDAKYKLLWTLRTQGAFDDKRYYSAYRDEDSSGITGVRLNGDVLQVAGDTLRSHIPVLGVRFLPLIEKLRFVASVLRYKTPKCSTEIYIPNFRTAFQHFCFPATGKSVVRETATRLKLGDRDMEPALMTLHRFGNQSSSSLWYELAYLEAKERVKKGDKVWQLGMGTGPKCNSVVMECIRPIFDEALIGPWADTINSYPVIIP
ncbi:3-ketoacyl-CoA synthase 5-like [Lycium barbarum]|uniref:3-ketoacyl-CoA synthase 5-like n=1 Tax=Lycium barbarum TaxID=112863 RepID=UPI00293F07CB|nr:3-ketoacyl-CoA synthase 5-like [Lycium barbarum]